MSMKKHFYISFISFRKRFSERKWQNCLVQLPPEMQQQVCNYRKWQDQHRALLGKLLIRQNLKYLGYPLEKFSGMQYSEFGRPYLPECADFNLSHSGGLIVCIFALSARVGVDTEKEKSIDVNEFKRVFSQDQFQFIMKSPEPIKAFFRLWTIKESVIKSEGSGLSLPLQQIETNFKTATMGTRKWHIMEPVLRKGYSTHIASDTPIQNFEIMKYFISENGLVRSSRQNSKI